MRNMIAYIDDSGTDPLQRVAISTALVVPTRQIVAMENEWGNLKQKEHFPDFHMAEFSARNPKSKFDWDDDKHERVYRRVREIIKKYGVRTVSFAVYKTDYDEVVPSDLRQYSGQFHCSWAVRHMLVYLLKWRLVAGVESPLEYIFDWMEERGPSRIEIETVLDQQQEVANELGLLGELEHISFRRGRDVPGLRCVDVLAWISYQYALLAFCHKPLSVDAKTGWADFEAYQEGKWREALVIGRSELQKWVSDPRAAEHTRKWFAERESRNLTIKMPIS